ncbi:MAG: GntR family transcriptional regulator [Kiritimatiellae bacterium]|nr:GntR family transcriptional regulator [Kiritimatiellia bacterium]
MKHPTKVRLIEQAIRARIADGALEPGAKLASIRRLAAQFQVCPATVKKALKRLKAEGVLEGSRGSGVYLKGRFQAQAVPIRSESKAEQISRALIEQITRGELLAGHHLPTPKVLRYQYRASGKTIAEALRLAVKSGLVRREGTVHTAGIQTATRAAFRGRRVIMVGTRPQMAEILANTRIREFFLEFERELQRGGIARLELLSENEFADLKQAELKETQGILYAGAAHRALTRGTCLTGLHAIRRSGLRAVIYNYPHLCDRVPGLGFKPTRRFFLNRIGFEAAGERIGLWLSSLGHTRVAFLTFYELEIASRAPYRHLKRAVERVGGAKAELAYLTGEFDYAELLPSDKRADLQRAVSALYRNVYDFRFLEPSRELGGEALAVIARDTMIARMRPLFDQALRRTNATAWVCDDEHVARCALDYLKEKRRAVPGDLSLVSLVDGEEAYIRGITAYDFERGRMGYLAAHAILDHIPVKRDRNGYLPNPGRIVERGSVERA